MFWSRSRQEVWRKGDTSGDRQFIREAYYDCDGDTLLFVVEQEGKGACHTGEHSCFYRPVRRLTDVIQPDAGTSSTRSPATTPSSRCGASCSPTSITPVAAFAAPASATSPASCSSRSSTASAGAAGRSSAADPAATLVARGGDGRRSTAALPDERPARPGHARRASRRCSPRYRSPSLDRAAAAARRARRLPRLRRRARGRAPARRARPTTSALPDAVLSIIGELAAFDHWRQRVTLIANAFVPRRRRPTPSSTAPTTRPSPASTSWPPTAPARSTSRWSSRPTPTTRCPRSRSTMGVGDYRAAVEVGQGAHPRRRHLPGRARRSASTSTSTPTRSTSTGCCARSTRARTCTSSATPR